MLKVIKDKIKNKNGMVFIEFLVGFLVFIFIFSFFFDLFQIGSKKFVMTQQASQIVRQLAKQSGIQSQVPLNYPGGRGSYLTSSQLIKVTEDKFKKIGVKPEDWSIEIILRDKAQANGERVISLSDTSNIKADYRDSIGIRFTYSYNWGLWSQLVPGDFNKTTNVDKYAFCEYKHDYSNWKGEED
ncbi:TPA: hypothetical protein UL242_002377 [Clostridioides difficile]|uniref:hypothetical protein n=1 Tax=Clostridioides difficile TaxID=1496 RepID=UPI000BB1EA7A|nr:hypothetical protein [Clostridioides difficile]EGT3641085.1 hypothetical protein [Clostridioides difficile]MBH7166056.1 hypothetical protein [Clostridioides difficile]MBH7845770.1 hypothetical protein [Clostridioides difficile]MBY1346638.1 hypothetical protein [Clostridioides difficile]MBY1661383.1 hypothetical protein [Clostridioides difficile]